MTPQGWQGVGLLQGVGPQGSNEATAISLAGLPGCQPADLGKNLALCLRPECCIQPKASLHMTGIDLL